jgi:hypothetical protein
MMGFIAVKVYTNMIIIESLLNRFFIDIIDEDIGHVVSFIG